jgi:hypothetical protein
MCLVPVSTSTYSQVLTISDFHSSSHVTESSYFNFFGILQEVDEVQENLEDDKDSEHNTDSLDGPDTSSFRAFLISFLSSSSSNNDSMEIIPEQNGDMGYPALTPMGKGSKGRTGLISRGKHSIGKIINKAARIGGFKQTTAEPKIDREAVTHTEPDAPVLERQEPKEVASFSSLPTMSEPSVLLSELMQSILYASLPVLAQGRNWVLLYRFKMSPILICSNF